MPAVDRHFRTADTASTVAPDLGAEVQGHAQAGLISPDVGFDCGRPTVGAPRETREPARSSVTERLSWLRVYTTQLDSRNDGAELLGDREFD